MSKNNKALFWTLSIFFLLWSIFGLLSFLGHTLAPEEMLKSMSQDEIALLNEFPLWTDIIFGIAVFGSILGSVLLLARSKRAKILFQVSLVAILVQMTYNVFFSRSVEVYGVAQTITMPIVVIVFAVSSLWFSGHAVKKGWIY